MVVSGKLTEAENELLDIVDENDNAMGQRYRSEIYLKKITSFRVINAFIVNSEGKIWVPRRTSAKRLFPSCMDASISGHVKSGETYYEAFLRETLEEVNIDVETEKYHFLRKLTPHEQGVSAFMNVYEIKKDDVLRYNKNDFSGYEWLYPEEIIRRIEQGEPSKGDLQILIDELYL